MTALASQNKTRVMQCVNFVCWFIQQIYDSFLMAAGVVLLLLLLLRPTITPSRSMDILLGHIDGCIYKSGQNDPRFMQF